jgi:hypothetical protein
MEELKDSKIKESDNEIIPNNHQYQKILYRKRIKIQ